MPLPQTLDPELGWVPAIPEPFWYRGWLTLFRERPACYRCQRVFLFNILNGSQPTVFGTREEWNRHYVLTHLQGDLEHEDNQDQHP